MYWKGSEFKLRRVNSELLIGQCPFSRKLVDANYTKYGIDLSLGIQLGLILVKRFSEYNYLPYRDISLRALGKRPGFSMVTKDDSVNVELEERTGILKSENQRNLPKKLTQNQSIQS